MAFLNIVCPPKNIDETRYSLPNKRKKLIAFNQTRLDRSINDSFDSISRYDVVRKERGRNEGRVCMYLRNFISYKIRHDLVPSELETICVRIVKPHNRPFLVIAVCRPPSLSSEFFDHFQN